MSQRRLPKILLVGPPGSGKGTQGALLAKQLGVEHVAIGDLLRAEIKSHTATGERIQAQVAAGELVADDLVLDLVAPHAERAAETGYILDGFPRSVEQAQLAREALGHLDARPDLVIYLDVPDDAVVERLLARAELEGRADDNEETIRNRLRIFHESTKPLLSFYEREGRARVIDATGTPAEVTARILGVTSTFTAEDQV